MKRNLFLSVVLGLGLCLVLVLLCLEAPKISASDAIPTIADSQRVSRMDDPAASDDLLPIRVDLEGQLGGPLRTVAVSGNLAFLGAGYHLQIVDLTDLDHPQARGNVNPTIAEPYSSFVTGVKVVGAYAYVVSDGLHVVDISNVDQPKSVGDYYVVNGHCIAVDVQGAYAYLACDHKGLEILDISDPYAPTRVGGLDLPGYANDVVVSGDYAYVAATNEGLRIVDVRDPAAPAEVGFYTLPYPSYVSQISLYGHYIYLVGTNDSDLRIVDISDPTTPQEVGLYEIDFEVDVAAANGIAFVASGYSVLHMIDVSQPDDPIEIAYFDTLAINGGGGGEGHRITVSGNTVYFADISGLWIVDAGWVSPPVGAGVFDTPGSAGGLAKHDDLLYVADGESGLRILDVSTTDSISEVGYLVTPGISQDVAVSGTIAYVAYGEAGGYDVEDAGLAIVDVSTPGSPAEMGVYDQVSNATAIAIANNTAFLSGGWGVPIIDVSLPMTPTLIGHYDDHCSSNSDVAIAGDLLLVACGGDGLHIVDVSKPDQPVQLAQLPASGSRIAVSGITAYGISGGILRAIDISVPLTPTLLGQVDLPHVERSHGLAINGNRAYVVTGKNTYPAEGMQGLHVIDIGDPTQMHEIGWFETGADTYGVIYDSGLTYLGAGTAGVNVVNVSDVSGLIEIGRYGLPIWAASVAVEGNYAYVANNTYGLDVIDVTRPVSPNWVGSFDQALNDPDIVVSGDHAYVTDQKGLRIVDISDPSRPVQIGMFTMLSDQAHAIVLTGTVAYVAGGDGLYIVDVSDPTQPEQLALYGESGYMYRLALAGNTLYAAGAYRYGSDRNFMVLDVSTPVTPIEVGSCDAHGRIAVSGTFAYVAGGSYLTVVDVGDPASPEVVGSYNAPTAGDVAVFGPYVLVSDRNYGLRVLDVKDPASPEQVGFYEMLESPVRIAVAGDLIYVADDDGGLAILSLREAEFLHVYLPLAVR